MRVAIAREAWMFIPKGESVAGRGVDEPFEVFDGKRTLELRMLQKRRHTVVLAQGAPLDG